MVDVPGEGLTAEVGGQKKALLEGRLLRLGHNSPAKVPSLHKLSHRRIGQQNATFERAQITGPALRCPPMAHGQWDIGLEVGDRGEELEGVEECVAGEQEEPVEAVVEGLREGIRQGQRKILLDVSDKLPHIQHRSDFFSYLKGCSNYLPYPFSYYD